MLPKLQLPLIEPEYVLQSMSEVYDWGLIDLNIPEVHKKTLGEGIKIGIIDSGQSEHFETIKNTVKSENFSQSREYVDRYGHSTFIAGIIAAEKNNQGIIGVAPKSQLYFAKAMNDSGTGNPSDLVRAINWCIAEEVDIISISAGMFFDFKPMHEAIKVAYSKNIIVIAAVGNTGIQNDNIAFPARYPEVISVAAYDKDRKPAEFSSRGLNIVCSMPGVNIYSCWLNNQFCVNNGTSFSAPMLSGLCALILAKHRIYQGNTPCNTPKEMMEHLEKYAVNIGNKRDVGFGTIDIKSMFNLD